MGNIHTIKYEGFVEVNMDILHIEGGVKLNGECEITSAKNSLLPILAGSIMCDGCVVLNKCAYYTDVDYMIKILESLGAKAEQNGDSLYINLKDANKYFVDEIFTKKVRSSIFMLGPLLSRFKRAKVAYPGGCNIGIRPIDLHLKGLRELNAKIDEKHGYIICDGTNMKAGNIHLDFPSVGATENLMMASVFLKGKTTINNVAKEPEIVDLQNFLNAMGACVVGAGTSVIEVYGVEKLHSVEFTPIPDRIITGTYVLACAMAGGKVRLKNTIPMHNVALINSLKQTGLKMTSKKDVISVVGSGRLKSVPKIETMPYPGFPTDLHPQIVAALTLATGVSALSETIFDSRFMYVMELVRLGADLLASGKHVRIRGVKKLVGAPVDAPDIRAGGSLVLAGLAAEGETIIRGVKYIDRGYQHLEQKLTALGAQIERVEGPLPQVPQVS